MSKELQQEDSSGDTSAPTIQYTYTIHVVPVV